MKSTFLKVMSILCVITGVIGIVVYVSNVIFGLYLGRNMYGSVKLIGLVIALITGIMGVVYWDNQAKRPDAFSEELPLYY